MGLFSRILVWVVAGVPVLVACGLLSGSMGAALGVFASFSKDLPTIPDLKAYRPKTVSTFYAEDGTVIGLFYKEKRFPIPLDSMPPHVVNAFVAAEDARFFSHTGVDIFGVIRAFVRNLKAGTFAQGGSTITQQVTRNLMLTKEKKVSRKIREAILAFRLEKTLSKQQILELYLNEIYLGKGSYGIEAAAGTYFGKTTRELSVPEAAFIAGLVSNPTKHSSNPDSALKRREFVLGGMHKHGFIGPQEYAQAVADVPRFRENLPNPFERVPYFTEAVRKYIVERYGENRLYNDGLQVWTTCDLRLQDKASESLLAGVKAWERRQGRPPGLVRRLKAPEVKEFFLTSAKGSHRVGDLVQAVVMTNHSTQKRKGKRQESKLQECTLALPGGAQFTLELESQIPFRTNDLLEFRVEEADGSRLSLKHETLPPLQGAVVCTENNTGYVRAVVGGLSFERSSFNRALQAQRQPGSAFKPFVYAAALEWGNYSPQTLIVDEPIAVMVDPHGPQWVPMNSDGGFHGPMTFKQALAHSRNIIAVKLLMDVGIDQTIQMAHDMGIRASLGANLSLALGSSEVTPLELAAAYTVFPNLGVKVNPVMVKKVVDRFGRVLEDNTVTPLDVLSRTMKDAALPREAVTTRPSPGESQEGLINEMRRLALPDQDPSQQSGLDRLLTSTFPTGDHLTANMIRVLSPQSAYLMVSALRETCVSGTAAAAGRLKRNDLAGKTGTTDDCTDAWFVGFNSKYTTGVWMGFDAKVSLGRHEYGGTAALPVWMSFMKEALTGQRSTGYPAPPGIVFNGVMEPARQTLSDPSLLQASPDFASAPELKQVCPVDTVFVPATGQMDPLTGQPIHSDYGYSSYPGAIRVLSQTGQTLGYASYSVDNKGRFALHRDTMMDAGLYESEADQQPSESSVQDSGMFRSIQRYLSPLLQRGWIQ
ncbi:MAG: PBP1A family penicillin-binding protein [Desulfomonile tiedjei]|uniref:peptidoglycan glycosyltransferase n=1 Tax=Desulfomonile tiedjei TaxID=2358 RepID=A0A9D6VA22_9BACT|nr:PBP1A family penicillin-binding protein [Desulfomonile tiedjei]